MSGSTSSFSHLLGPVAPGNPCGEDLEDSQLLASFESRRIFGQMSALPTTVNWRELRDQAAQALDRSRDLRLLAYLAAGAVRIDGLTAFCELLTVASAWLSGFKETVYPRVVEDAIARKNALNCLADRIAIVDALRRSPFVANRQLGAFSLRDLDIAAGKIPAGDGTPPTSAQIEAALAAADAADLSAVHAAAASGVAALRSIEGVTRENGGSQAVPSLEALSAELARLEKTLKDHLASRTGASGAIETGVGPGEAAAVEPGAAGPIRSRQDAARALDTVAAYFRQYEPSSPVTLFVERAKRLIGKDFLATIADIVPEAVSQAKQAGGIRDEA